MNRFIAFIHPALRFLIFLLCKLFFRLRVVGKENVPKEGALLVYSNHLSNFDPLIVGCVIPRPLHFMAKEELFRQLLFARLLLSLGAFPVKRGKTDPGAVKKGLQVLKQGKALLLFPEGSRSRDGQVRKALPGVALFALRTDAAVVPVAIIGKYRLFGSLTVVFSSPMDLTTERQTGVSEPEILQSTAERMMNEVKKVIEGHGSEAY